MLPFQAVDGDPAGTPGSTLSYSISFVNGDPSSPLFTIDASTGQVSAGALDYETVATHMYGLTVTVTDGGMLSVDCSVTVNIRVSPSNHSHVRTSMYNNRTLHTATVL